MRDGLRPSTTEREHRTRMISLRLSEGEYRRLCDYCRLNGMRSLSEVARMGVERILNAPGMNTEALQAQIEELIVRVRALERHVGSN